MPDIVHRVPDSRVLVLRHASHRQDMKPFKKLNKKELKREIEEAIVKRRDAFARRIDAIVDEDRRAANRAAKDWRNACVRLARLQKEWDRRFTAKGRRVRT